MHTNSSSTLDLGDYIAILKRRWIWVLLPVIVAPWAAFFLSSSQPDRFTSSARVLLGDTAAQEAIDAGSQNITFRNRQLENELRLATGDDAVGAIADVFGTDIDTAPTARITAESDADVLVFEATARNPESAANIANAWAETYLALKEDQTIASIGGAIDQLEAKLIELEEARQEVRADLVRFEDRLAVSTDAGRAQAQLQVDREASRISGQVTLIDAQIRATAASISELTLSADLALGNGPRIIMMATPSGPTSAPVSRNIVLGVVLGLVAGAALALLREALDTAVRTPEDLEQLGLVHLGSIPKATNIGNRDLALDSLEAPGSAQAAAYQKVRAAIEFAGIDRDLRSIVVTSAQQGEGKTTVSSNLAVAMAQASRRTILVDGDLRRPRIHKVFRTKQSPGITSVVLDAAKLPEAAWPIPSLAESLVVVPAGPLPPHPASFIGGAAFAKTTTRIAGLGDFTIIDAPPLLPVADTLSLSKHVSGVLMVVDAGSSKADDVALALASLTKAGATVVGAVLIGVKVSSRSAVYRYAAEDDVERMPAADAAASVDRNRGRLFDLRAKDTPELTETGDPR